MKAKQKRPQTKKVTARASAVKKPLTSRVRSHAKKALVPHKENDFRPHLIRAHGLIAVLVIALIAQVAYSFATTGRLTVLGTESDVHIVELLDDTNHEREGEGLSELALNDKLSQAALLKAQDMFEEQYWAHVSPSGTQPWKWFGDVGYNYSYAGENLAKNYPTAQATVDAWMASETHRENILKPEYVDVGFAVVNGELEGKSTTLIVALYGAPVNLATAVASPEAQVVEQVASPVFTASTIETQSSVPFAYFASALATLSPVTIAILGLLAIVGIVGVAAHHYRKQLPKAWRRSWRVHHGLYTFVGTIVVGILVIIATSGGQI